MIGILTEKPSAARNFAKALGGMRGVYQGEEYVITNARGHLYEYADPSKQVVPALSAQYKSWNLQYLPWNESDFAWKREKKKDTGALLSTISSVLNSCDEVCIATDVDPTGEGELLAWEILDELNICNKKFSRMYFTDESVVRLQKAFVERKTLTSMEDDMDFVKARYRSQWDMLSMQFTRIATNCVGNAGVLRQGRLKSAMVVLVGDGLAALQAYKRVPFYMNKFRDENGIVYTNPEEPRFPEESQVPQTYQPSDVVTDEVSMKSTAPPKLIDLAGLSSTLAGQGVSAKEVLSVYQKMYEAGIVSYPRTEDKVITPEQFNELLPLVDKIAGVVGVDTGVLTHRQARGTHVKVGGAHGANRPGLHVPSSLSALTSYGACAPAIYEILAKNYLAMLAEDYQYEQQKGHIKDYPKFTGTAAVPKFKGWKLVYHEDDDVDENESAVGLGTRGEPFVFEGVNPKPPKPTMKWLMRQLEKSDVGTGATRTSTYADVTSSKAKYPLLAEKRGVISMSPYGDMSYILLKDTKIGDIATTEQLMQDMRDIAAGKVSPEECLHRMQDLVRHDMEVMQQNKPKLATLGGDAAKKLSENTSMQAKEKYAGCWNGKDVVFNRTWGGHRFTDDECVLLCSGGEVQVEGISKKTNKPYKAMVRLDNLTYNGHKYVGCTICDCIPDMWCGHRFSEDERILLESGKKVKIDGCVSKGKNVFSCTVEWKDEGGRMKIVPMFDKK